MSPPHSAIFEEAIKVIPLTSHTYSAYLQETWCIGNAILYRLATTHFAQSQESPYRSKKILPISFQLTFVRPAYVGPVALTVQEIKLGVRTSTIHVTLSQEGRPKSSLDPLSASAQELKVAGYITVSPEDVDQEGSAVTGNWDLHPSPLHGSKSNGAVDFDALVANEKDGQWTKIPKVPVVAASQHIDVFSAVPGPNVQARINSTVDQWARFCPGGGTPAKWTNEALMYLVDMFPMALDRLGAMATSTRPDTETSTEGKPRAPDPFWYPTVTLNVDLKKSLPNGGAEWLYSRVVTKAFRAGRADLDVAVLDQDGELVALSSQVCMVVGIDRNLRNSHHPRQKL
ncbi:hypothetical protein BBP40_011347 [Aspergillus hancockii]|nr:hypothetical protein BBP40_011347 [Aspergillus hancockii]